jgi:hypothetical protein
MKDEGGSNERRGERERWSMRHQGRLSFILHPSAFILSIYDA